MSSNKIKESLQYRLEAIGGFAYHLELEKPSLDEPALSDAVRQLEIQIWKLVRMVGKAGLDLTYTNTSSQSHDRFVIPTAGPNKHVPLQIPGNSNWMKPNKTLVLTNSIFVQDPNCYKANQLYLGNEGVNKYKTGTLNNMIISDDVMGAIAETMVIAPVAPSTKTTMGDINQVLAIK